ncbi:MAG: 2Fe-2S iron-sulfur cluster-binding protein [Bryobacteraceae bacterium]
MPKLSIDGREVSVADGTTVIQAAEKLEIFVPRYCYHPGLSIAGNCRICLVDVERVPKLQIACNTPVIEGMVVHTKSDKAESGRRAVLEFLLANHPLDCPVCDQSGECDLQNFYLDFGLYNPRFREQKVKKRKAAPIGPHVMLDQERCILCSRCVRFTDEITKTGELGIFSRGDHAEVGVCDGNELNNRYSANVVDICPVGALTERDFRFKARVWYLSSAPTVCNGCSQGCNVDLHYVLDRPHLNEGKRVVRVKPRYNADVNQWWICDEGRYGFEWIDRRRLDQVRGPSGGETWEQALTAISTALNGRIGVIASTQLTNEELYLVRAIFRDSLDAQVTASVPDKPGYSDNFLVKADKNPNTLGATLLGLAGAEAPRAEQILDDALAGNLDALWVMGHDLVELFGEEKARNAAQRVRLLVFSGTNENATVPLANWVLPSAAYVEKDGTFVNCHGRVQRIGCAFPPPKGSREDWRFLLELAVKLGIPFACRGPEQIFLDLAKVSPPFERLTYEAIGAQGINVATATS